jgi:hypothetical protein
MPFSLNTEPGLLRIVFFDDITPADLLSLADAVEEIERALLVTPNRLIDLSQISIGGLTYLDVLAVAERRRVQRLANPVNSAIVAPRPVQVGFARMFQTLAEHPQIAIRTFSTLAEAETWLAVERSDL